MSYDRMGIGVAEKSYECDGCHSTVLCAPGELTKWGWKRHYGGTNQNPTWELILCDDCEARSGKK